MSFPLRHRRLDSALSVGKHRRGFYGANLSLSIGELALRYFTPIRPYVMRARRPEKQFLHAAAQLAPVVCLRSHRDIRREPAAFFVDRRCF